MLKINQILQEKVSSKALSGGLLCLAMSTLAPLVNASIISSTDVPKLIPDNNPTGISSTVFVDTNNSLTDLNLIFDEVRHVFIPDLHVELTSPSGTTSTIIKASSEGGIFFNQGQKTDLMGTILDDDAVTNLADGSAPFTGAFNVEHISVIANPLSLFDGEDPFGTWTLTVSDLAPLDVGSLNAWSLEVTTVPIPDAFLLFGTGLIGFCTLRKSTKHPDLPKYQSA